MYKNKNKLTNSYHHSKKVHFSIFLFHLRAENNNVYLSYIWKIKIAVPYTHPQREKGGNYKNFAITLKILIHNLTTKPKQLLTGSALVMNLNLRCV